MRFQFSDAENCEELTNNALLCIKSVMEAEMRLICCFIVMMSAATEEIKNLTGTEGGNITLPDPVLESGFISFERKLVATMSSGTFKIFEDIYTNRLHWDKNTELFTITGLQKSDSGIYTIDSKEGNIFLTNYKLTVYDPVPTPAVNTESVSTESCILLCSVDKAETTLLWYKDQEIVNQSSSALSLTLTVHKQEFRSSYRCVAENPAEHKTLHVNIKTSCWNITEDGDNSGKNQSARNYIVAGIISTVFVVALICFIIIAKKKFHMKSETISSQPQEPERPDVLYTEVQTRDNIHGQGGSSQDSSGTVYRSNLTTVYDQLEAHRLVPQSDTARRGSNHNIYTNS